MGFFSWLFSLFRREKTEESEMPVSNAEQTIMQTQGEENVYKKPPYKKIPRTPETKAYVNSMVKKASSPDLKPTPHKDNVDRTKVEKFVDKMQGRK